jgi:hypothetical protein
LLGTAGAAMASGAAGVAGAAPPPVTDSFSISIDLDAPGSGVLDAFDPSLGTLIRVDYTVATDVLIQVCIENLSTASGTTGGPAGGELSVTYPGGVVTTSSVATTIPTQALPGSNGSDDCLAAFDDASRTFPSGAGGDALFFSATDPQTASGSITDAAGLAPFIGPGTVPFSWTATSNANIVQPSEWDIWFVAQGELEVTVAYTYTTEPTTTTTPLPCIPPGGTLPPGATLPPGVTAAVCALPPTGAASNTWTLIALVIMGAGGALTALAAVGRRRLS